MSNTYTSILKSKTTLIQGFASLSLIILIVNKAKGMKIKSSKNGIYDEAIIKSEL